MALKDRFFWERAQGLSDDIISRAYAPRVFSVPTGWIKIVNDLNEKLKVIDPNYTIEQIKEKFAAMRFYATFAPDKAEACEALINLAEIESTKICQICGTSGTRSNPRGTWLMTLCPTHIQKITNETEEQRSIQRNAEAKEYMDAVRAQQEKEKDTTNGE